MKKIIFLVCFWSTNVLSQTLCGTVKDGKTEEAIPFASIQIFNGRELTKTIHADPDGKFCLDAKPGNLILAISSISYYSDTVELFITPEIVSNSIEITLTPDSASKRRWVSGRDSIPVLMPCMGRLMTQEELEQNVWKYNFSLSPDTTSKKPVEIVWKWASFKDSLGNSFCLNLLANQTDSNGLKQGVWKKRFFDYHDKTSEYKIGQLMWKGNYLDDKKDGEWKYYSPEKKVYKAEIWSEGVLREIQSHLPKIYITTTGLRHEKSEVFEAYDKYEMDEQNAGKFMSMEIFRAEVIRDTLFYTFVTEITKDKPESRITYSPKFYLLNEPFPQMVEKDANGNPFSVEQLKGKVTVVNFWYTACPPCVAEIPAMNELRERYKDSVNFLAVCFSEDPYFESFLEKQPFNFRHLLPSIAEHKKLGIDSYPTLLILDRTGKIVVARGGLIQKKNPNGTTEIITEYFENQLNRVLERKPFY